jgi:YVTN family beta-propeller protein
VNPLSFGRTPPSSMRRPRSLAAALLLAGLAFLSNFSIAARPSSFGAPALAAAAGQLDPASPAPKAYAGLFGDNAVAVIDTGTDKVLRTISVPAGPHGMVITPDGRRVYVSSDGDSTVSVIDTGTDVVTTTIQVGQAPHGLAVTPNGRWVLAAVFGANQVAAIDTTTNQVVAQLPVPSPHNIAISPDGKTAYVAAQQAGATELAILDLAGPSVSGGVPLDKTPRALSFRPDGKQLYFTEAGVDAVQVLDPASNTVVKQIPVGASPHHPAFTPSGEYGLVVNQGPGSLSIIEPDTDTVIGTVAVGRTPHWIATDGEDAYVTNEGSNDVSVVNLDSQQVITTIPVGNAPRKIVIQPANEQLAQDSPAPSSPSTSVGDDSGVSVSIQSFAFMPQNATVTAGQMITWTNMDSQPHTVTSDDGFWDSGPLQPGDSFSVPLDQPGSYAYHCSIHPFMHGTVVVGN